MKVALLSQGPSLEKTWPGPERYDVVVGVNLTAFRWPCDWWALADADAYRRWRLGTKDRNENPLTLLGDPRFFLHRGVIGDLRNHVHDPTAGAIDSQWLIDLPKVKFHDEAALPAPILESLPRSSLSPAVRWNHYGGPTGLVCAFQSGASEIDCYGVDLAGVTDFLGGPNHTRNEARWAQEWLTWTKLVDGMAKFGVTVRRATDKGWIPGANV